MKLDDERLVGGFGRSNVGVFVVSDGLFVVETIECLARFEETEAWQHVAHSFRRGSSWVARLLGARLALLKETVRVASLHKHVGADGEQAKQKYDSDAVDDHADDLELAPQRPVGRLAGFGFRACQHGASLLRASVAASSARGS